MGFSFKSLFHAPGKSLSKAFKNPGKTLLKQFTSAGAGALGGPLAHLSNEAIFESKQLRKNFHDWSGGTYSPSLFGKGYRDLVKKPRAEQERKQAEAQRRAYDLAHGRTNIASAAVLGQGQGALGDVRSGYGEALSQVEPLRQAERARVTEDSAFAQAQAKQQAVSRGLYNTSLVADSQRGVATETSRALADIENRYAAIKAQLQAGEAGATADVTSQI